MRVAWILSKEIRKDFYRNSPLQTPNSSQV